MKAGRIVVDGVSVLGPQYIIPFKMYAWLNNKSDKEAGLAINERNISKHRNDVFRLLTLLNPDDKILLEGNVRLAFDGFIKAIKEEPVDDRILGGRTKVEAIELLSQIYG